MAATRACDFHFFFIGFPGVLGEWCSDILELELECGVASGVLREYLHKCNRVHWAGLFFHSCCYFEELTAIDQGVGLVRRG